MALMYDKFISYRHIIIQMIFVITIQLLAMRAYLIQCQSGLATMAVLYATCQLELSASRYTLIKWLRKNSSTLMHPQQHLLNQLSVKGRIYHGFGCSIFLAQYQLKLHFNSGAMQLCTKTVELVAYVIVVICNVVTVSRLIAIGMFIAQKLRSSIAPRPDVIMQS